MFLLNIYLINVSCYSLYVQWRFKAGIENQFNALKKGFSEIIPQHLLKPFDEKELELVISGLGKIDVLDWKMNTKLRNCSLDTEQIKWFWKVRVSYYVTDTVQFCITYQIHKCTIQGKQSNTFLLLLAIVFLIA